MSIKQTIRNVARKFGVDIIRYRPESGSDPKDLSDVEQRILSAVRPFTMTSVERLLSVIDATRHVVQSGIPGAIVECGVWRGGSSMAAIMTLQSLSRTDREVFLYDTFEGMSEPTAADRSFDGMSAADQLAQEERGTGVWCCASLEDVRNNLRATGYPENRIHLVKGKVEDTIPRTLPGPIALLRLDTDWYESTRHELQHLFPLLHPKGILIVDDYGHWLGARKAVDEFFAAKRGDYFFHRIDYTGRLIVRLGA